MPKEQKRTEIHEALSFVTFQNLRMLLLPKEVTASMFSSKFSPNQQKFSKDAKALFLIKGGRVGQMRQMLNFYFKFWKYRTLHNI